MFYIAQRDQRTIVLSDNVERLRHMVESKVEKPSESASPPRSGLDGGLAKMTLGKISLQLLFQILDSQLSSDARMAFEAVAAEAAAVIQADVLTTGVGIDLDPATDEIKLRVAVRCVDAAAAQRVQAAFSGLQSFAKSQVAELAAFFADQSKVATVSYADAVIMDGHSCWTRMLADAIVEVREGDGGAVELWIDASAPFPQKLFTAYMPGSAEKVERR